MLPREAPATRPAGTALFTVNHVLRDVTKNSNGTKTRLLMESEMCRAIAALPSMRVGSTMYKLVVKRGGTPYDKDVHGYTEIKTYACNHHVVRNGVEYGPSGHHTLALYFNSFVKTCNPVRLN